MSLAQHIPTSSYPQSNQILTSSIASISELKKNPMSIATATHDDTVAILNRNKPVFYCISPELLAYYQEIESDRKLNAIADERLQDLQAVEVSLDDL